MFRKFSSFNFGESIIRRSSSKSYLGIWPTERQTKGRHFVGSNTPFCSYCGSVRGFYSVFRKKEQHMISSSRRKRTSPTANLDHASASFHQQSLSSFPTPSAEKYLNLHALASEGQLSFSRFLEDLQLFEGQQVKLQYTYYRDDAVGLSATAEDWLFFLHVANHFQDAGVARKLYSLMLKQLQKPRAPPQPHVVHKNKEGYDRLDSPDFLHRCRIEVLQTLNPLSCLDHFVMWYATAKSIEGRIAEEGRRNAGPVDQLLLQVIHTSKRLDVPSPLLQYPGLWGTVLQALYRLGRKQESTALLQELVSTYENALLSFVQSEELYSPILQAATAAGDMETTVRLTFIMYQGKASLEGSAARAITAALRALTIQTPTNLIYSFSSLSSENHPAGQMPQSIPLTVIHRIDFTANLFDTLFRHVSTAEQLRITRLVISFYVSRCRKLKVEEERKTMMNGGRREASSAALENSEGDNETPRYFARRIIHTMKVIKENNCTPDAFCFSSLMQCYLSMPAPLKAFEVYQLCIQEFQVHRFVELSDAVFELAMVAAAQLRDLRKAREVMTKFYHYLQVCESNRKVVSPSAGLFANYLIASCATEANRRPPSQGELVTEVAGVELPRMIVPTHEEALLGSGFSLPFFYSIEQRRDLFVATLYALVGELMLRPCPAIAATALKRFLISLFQEVLVKSAGGHTEGRSQGGGNFLPKRLPVDLVLQLVDCMLNQIQLEDDTTGDQDFFVAALQYLFNIATTNFHEEKEENKLWATARKSCGKSLSEKCFIQEADDTADREDEEAEQNAPDTIVLMTASIIRNHVLNPLQNGKHPVLKEKLNEFLATLCTEPQKQQHSCVTFLLPWSVTKLFFDFPEKRSQMEEDDVDDDEFKNEEQKKLSFYFEKFLWGHSSADPYEVKLLTPRIATSWNLNPLSANCDVHAFQQQMASRHRSNSPQQQFIWSEKVILSETAQKQQNCREGEEEDQYGNNFSQTFSNGRSRASLSPSEGLEEDEEWSVFSDSHIRQHRRVDEEGRPPVWDDTPRETTKNENVEPEEMECVDYNIFEPCSEKDGGKYRRPSSFSTEDDWQELTYHHKGGKTDSVESSTMQQTMSNSSEETRDDCTQQQMDVENESCSFSNASIGRSDQQPIAEIEEITSSFTKESSDDVSSSSSPLRCLGIDVVDIQRLRARKTLSQLGEIAALKSKKTTTTNTAAVNSSSAGQRRQEGESNSTVSGMKTSTTSSLSGPGLGRKTAREVPNTLSSTKRKNVLETLKKLRPSK